MVEVVGAGRRRHVEAVHRHIALAEVNEGDDLRGPVAERAAAGLALVLGDDVAVGGAAGGVVADEADLPFVEVILELARLAGRQVVLLAQLEHQPPPRR